MASFLSVVSPSTGSTKARRYPLSYIFSGNYYGTGEVGNQGTGGSWWTHTVYDSSTAYRLGMSGTGLNPQLDYAKNGGFSLRCITQNFFFQKI